MLKRQLRQNLVIVFSLFKISSSNSERDCLSTTKEQSFRTIGKRTCAKETNLSITPQRFSAVLEEVGWLSLADRSSLNRGQPCQLGTAWPLSTRRQASRGNVGAARKRWQKRRHALIWDTVSRSRASQVVSRLCQYGPERAASTAATCPTKVCLFLLAVAFIDSFAAYTSRAECDRSDYFRRNYISKVIG